jgi:hypothetical protein
LCTSISKSFAVRASHVQYPYAILFYSFSPWLGAYLLARNSQKITVRLTGWGLLAYALALATQIIFSQFILVILLLPPLL